MADPPSSVPTPWLLMAAALLLFYRLALVSLLAAFHAMPSLQRRRLLEEGGIANPRLAALLGRPRILGMGLEFAVQLLLLLFLALLWPFHAAVPGGEWVLGPLLLLALWALDLAIPAQLTSGDPPFWLSFLFPLYAPLEPLLEPLVAPLARAIERRQAEERNASEDDPTQEAVTALLEEGEAEGILAAGDRELIRNVVTFGDTVVREVMTPRTRIVALPLEANLPEAWRAFTESRHSRMPVYEGGIDHIRGVLLLKDLMQLPDQAQASLGGLLKPPLFVPESKPILDLLREMQRARTQLAVVVDEFGGVSGLVTVEDLLEEVFGEIRDEHEAAAELVEQSPGVFLVSGQAHVEDVARRLGLVWERDGFDTLAGLVLARLGRIPRPQESVAVEGARLTVLRMEGTRISHVKVERA